MCTLIVMSVYLFCIASQHLANPKGRRVFSEVTVLVKCSLHSTQLLSFSFGAFGAWFIGMRGGYPLNSNSTPEWRTRARRLASVADPDPTGYE